MRRAAALLAGAWIALATPLAAQQVTDVTAIPLRAGVNRIEGFAPDGREAQVVLAWRENGNAHGYSLFMVMLPGRPGGSDWNVVGLEQPEGDPAFQDVLRDQPHAGEDVVRAVRLARGRVDGRPATLVIIATRELNGEPYPSPAPVRFEVFALASGRGEIGVTRDYFRRVSVQRLEQRSCNAELALSQRFGLPIRGGRTPLNRRDGCA